MRDFLATKLQEKRRIARPDGQELEGEPLARTTVGHVRAALHACLAEAIDDEILASNPAALQRRSRTVRLAPTRAERRARVKAFTAEQLRAFLAAAAGEGQARGLLFRLMAGTGVRPGEALACAGTTST